MEVQTTRVFETIQYAKDKGYTTVSEQGSSRSGKTWNTVLWLIVRCLQYPGTTVSIVRATLPAIKGSVYRDFKENMFLVGAWNEKCMNKSELIYSFPNGSWIEFFSCDNEQKIRGRKRKILYVNEGNELKFIEWQQLQMRTTEFSIIDYNPSFTDDHWLCTLNKEQGTYHFITTYKDNPFLEQKVIDEIESLQWKNPSLWQVYGLGLQAVIEGLIFEDVEYVDEIPQWAQRKSWLGMDLGYTCFRGDTLITTARGDVPISKVVAGDYVLTTKGYRKVLKRHDNGVKEVVEKSIKVAGKEITFHATNEHKFKTNGKWKKYGELTEEDNLYVLSSLWGSNTRDTQMANTQTTIITNGRKMGDIAKNSCIMRYTSITMERYRKVMSYITKTKILSTTALKTLCLSLRMSIGNFIQRLFRNIEQKNMRCLYVLLKTTGSKDTESLVKSSQNQKKSVNIAAMNLHQQMCTRDSVTKNVITSGNTHQTDAIQSLSANGVEKNSKGTNISDPKHAPVSAHIDCLPIEGVTEIRRELCKVYDLEVEGIHEYFANGVCVHNCDPTSLTHVCLYNDTLYIDEVCYRTKMLSSDIINAIKQKNREDKREYKVISESADPRMIDEVYNAGIDIHPVRKFGGSIMAGIQKMKEFKIKVTKRSTNIRKEFKNYTYRQDKEGKWLNEPIDGWNHAIDAIRYVVLEEILGGYGQGLSAEELADML